MARHLLPPARRDLTAVEGYGELRRAIYLIPVVAILRGYALLGERPPAVAVAGGALCLAGVAISRR
jgi:drug/metabolite transporter (DMT)-like permease